MALGSPFALRRLLQPPGLDDRIGRHGFDVHRADEVVVRGVGAVVPEEVVARDRLEVAEHALRRTACPGARGSCSRGRGPRGGGARRRSFAWPSAFFRCQSRSSRRVRKRCARMAASTATPKTMLRTPLRNGADDQHRRQDGGEQHSDHRAPVAAAPAEHRRSAEHHRRDAWAGRTGRPCRGSSRRRRRRTRCR